MCTEIILCMLEAQGINPNEHIPEEPMIESGSSNDEVEAECSDLEIEGESQPLVGNVLSERQRWEEENLPAIKRQKANKKAIAEGLKALDKSDDREEGELSD